MNASTTNTTADFWDAKQYMHFGNERLRPALDLLAYVPEQEPQRVVDLGCGTGNVSALLKARWPAADVLGVDSSENMLAAAAAAVPECRFEHADLAHWQPDGLLDVIYSNATLQWLPDHPALLPRLLSFLRRGAWLAVQMPAMHNAPLRQMQAELARSPAFAPHLQKVPQHPSILTAENYYDLLRSHCTKLDIWETTYLHTLRGADAVAEWAAGTSLRPYLDALPEDQRPAFRAAYAAAMRTAYPQRENGVTLLPFKRLFIVANV
ncbi:trans-aconitate 2-methyltransferase [Collimonas sp.]|jgi:trans-aconitate 2-methyltransferase|uniref:trans-aconitate 2-methyltransferase n=1 Tax=Collimonas sp. TaxID=1963772 RepID=UPI002CEACB01|nr:trans-aconitate 2-methyltransferase [Collimonas sp.]HWW04737.1 trans-aconitate 2-methyltransferase [Collimonas sp.]